MLRWVATTVALAGLAFAGLAFAGAAPAGASPTARYGVGEIVVRYVDHTRTVRFGQAKPVPRPLPTVIRYPIASPAVDARGAPPARGSFPLIVFAHGYDVTPGTYAALMRAWVRAGYVVAAPYFPLTNANAPGDPDEADIINQPADMRVVITRILAASAAAGGPLAGLVDPAQIAVAGQSDGGSTALDTAYDHSARDHRVDAAIVLSGAEWAGLDSFPFAVGTPPLLAVQGTADPLNFPASTYRYFHLARPPKFLLSLLRAGHLGPYTTEQPQLGIVERETLAFLDRYLKHRSGAARRMWSAGDVPGVAALSTHAPAVPAAARDSPAHPKRGIASARYEATDPARLTKLGAAWTYDWSATPPTRRGGPPWVAMAWGPGSVTRASMAALTAARRARRVHDLLGFNEPDNAGQSNISPQRAAALWPALARTGLVLGSPAPAVPTDGWLERFMALARARHLRVDFIALHYYQDFTDPNAVPELRSQLIAIHRRYHRPIWITEIGALDIRRWGESMRHVPTAALARRYMRSLFAMLDRLSFVQRYAWFTDQCSSDPGCRMSSLYDAAGRPTGAGRTFATAP